MVPWKAARKEVIMDLKKQTDSWRRGSSGRVLA
jgi:hypothetical protein